MKSRICTILCLLTMLGFVVLFVQGQWKPFDMKPLHGFTPVAEKPALTIDGFASGHYQSDVENYIGDNFGFREFFIRAYNQFSYSCFRKINNDNIKEGLQRELYLKMYLEEITGNTFKSHFSDIEEAKAKAEANVAATVRLVDTMQSHGTQFLFVFAPSKTWVYPENMPSYYREQTTDFSLEDYYIRLFKENNIPHIDFLNYFKSWKDTADYPLYTRYGTHWAASTLPFVVDSIVKKIADLTRNDLPDILCLDAPLSTSYTIHDAELENQMNLLFPLRKPALPQPVMALGDTLGKDRPNLLVIGDSYFGILLDTPFCDIFNHWDYWEYNKTVFSSNDKYNYARVIDFADAYKILKDADVVMVVSTAPMIYNYMFGFPSTAFGLYETMQCDSCMHEIQVEKYMKIIRNDSQWYEAVCKQAAEKGITEEQALRGNAEYMLYMESQTGHEE